MTCNHKTIGDHSRVIAMSQLGAQTLTVAGPATRVWTCTDCGREGQWADGWAYHGVLECRDCSANVIDHVSCGCDPRRGKR